MENLAEFIHKKLACSLVYNIWKTTFRCRKSRYGFPKNLFLNCFLNNCVYEFLNFVFQHFFTNHY